MRKKQLQKHCYRIQFPLDLASIITAHRAQRQTMADCRVSWLGTWKSWHYDATSDFRVNLVDVQFSVFHRPVLSERHIGIDQGVKNFAMAVVERIMLYIIPWICIYIYNELHFSRSALLLSFVQVGSIWPKLNFGYDRSAVTDDDHLSTPDTTTYRDINTDSKVDSFLHYFKKHV